MKFILEHGVMVRRPGRNVSDNVATHWLVQCPTAARGTAIGLLLSRKLSDSRRLSVQSKTTLASLSQLPRSSDQAQVLTCAIRLTPRNMLAQPQSTTTWADLSSQFSSDHLRATTWWIWARRRSADLCRARFLRVQAHTAKALRRVICLGHKHLAQQVSREGAVSTLDLQIMDPPPTSRFSLSNPRLLASQKIRDHLGTERF